MDRKPVPAWVRLLGVIVVAIVAIPFVIVTIAAQAKDTRR
ncbi:Uncharacterised protein [Sphingomonas paucimobilis]|nr:Uncharacterised protein [Sphingomonas paucimobilis]